MDRPDKRIRKIKVIEEGCGILRESPDKQYHVINSIFLLTT